MVASAKENIKQKVSNSEIHGNMQVVLIQMDSSPIDTVIKELEDLKEAIMKEEDPKDKFDPENHIDAYLPVRVNVQRVNNFLQSLLMAASVCAMLAIKLTPTSVLWGYFAYMTIDSLPRNQFWERMLLIFIAPDRVLEAIHASFVETIPFKYITIFTIFQLVYFLVCFGVTWILIAGILFPVPFCLCILISIRQHISSKLFRPDHLQELDVAEYEEITGSLRLSGNVFYREREALVLGNEEGKVEMCDAEISDELATVKVRKESFKENNTTQLYSDGVVQPE